ncbi:hypothetical protein Pcinc_036584, partial [Petrolisthes cinctipes]
RLVKSYLPKKKECEDLQFSSVRSFRDVVMRQQTWQHLSDGNRVQQQLHHSLQQLEKSKKNYEKAFREAEKAQDNYLKADADLHLSRAEVEKQRMNASIKNQQCEDSKTEYANQLQKTNQLQGDHYNTVMPGIFQGLQDLDEKRINNFKNLLKKSVEIERSVFPIINKCLDGIVSAAESIDEHSDSQVVIERYKSGFTPPGDIPFDDLSTPRQNGGGGGLGGGGGGVGGGGGGGGDGNTPTTHTPLRQDTIKGTISASKLKKRGGIFGIFASNKNNFSFSEKDDFSDLPPNQRKKRIQQRIDDVTTKLHQETAARDGLLKMKEVYEGNPSLGDPMSIMGQLNDSCQRIEKLRSELQRYQNMLDDVDGDIQQQQQSGGGGGGGGASGGPSTPNASLTRQQQQQQLHHPHHHHINNNNNTSGGVGIGGGGGASPRSSVASHRTSLSDESLSRSSHSPESGIGLSHNSLPGSDTYDQPDGDDNTEFYDTEPLPVIGTCRALYNFDGTSEGSMNMTEGEELNVIEIDQGDGWTRVRRVSSFEEGFVPTSYIEMTLYNNC